LPTKTTKQKQINK